MVLPLAAAAGISGGASSNRSGAPITGRTGDKIINGQRERLAESITGPAIIVGVLMVGYFLLKRR